MINTTMYGIDASTDREKVKVLYTFLTMPWGVYKEVSVSMGEDQKKKVSEYGISRENRIFPEMRTFTSEEVSAFDLLLKSFKAGGKEAIGVGEDENGERVSLAVLPGMDKVIVNFVGKVNRDEFFEAYELANVLL